MKSAAGSTRVIYPNKEPFEHSANASGSCETIATRPFTGTLLVSRTRLIHQLHHVYSLCPNLNLLSQFTVQLKQESYRKVISDMSYQPIKCCLGYVAHAKENEEQAYFPQSVRVS